MVFLTAALDWAEDIFGGCDLGDVRRTRRVVDMGRRLAAQSGASMAKCCDGDAAAQLGSYRLIENEKVSAQAIREGGFESVARRASEHQRLLAIEDTTALSYRHSLAEQLGPIGTEADGKTRGFLVHSVLLVECQSERTVGLIEQHHWSRDASQHGRRHKRKERAYADKESFKWQRASEQVAARLGSDMDRVISVCDRESDVYEYLSYKLEHGQRFVVRASVDRCVEDSSDKLLEVAAKQAPIIGERTVHVAQRAGRKARDARVLLRAIPMRLRAPKRLCAAAPALGLNVVLVQEIDPPEDVTPLCWYLLTGEPVDDLSGVQRVVRDYELRWRIEEYHKAWKSGVRIEHQRLQSASNLERMIAITAFVAVRLLQLNEVFLAQSSRAGEAPEPTVLEREEWRVLWVSTERCAPPDETPSAAWTYTALARLGGFTDTKRTGRAGWATIWQGWFRLHERLEGYRLSQMVTGNL